MSKSNKQTVREKAHQFMQGFIIKTNHELLMSEFNEWFEFEHHYRKMMHTNRRHNGEPNLESLALSIFNAMCTNSGLYQINNLGTGFFKTWKIEYDEKNRQAEHPKSDTDKSKHGRVRANDKYDVRVQKNATSN